MTLRQAQGDTLRQARGDSQTPNSTLKERGVGTQNLDSAVPTFSPKGRNQGRNSQEKVGTEYNSLQNNKLEQSFKWITVDEGRNRLGISDRALRKHCKQGHFVTRKVRMNGGFGYEIALESVIRYYRDKGDVEKVMRCLDYARQQLDEGTHFDELSVTHFDMVSNRLSVTEESAAKYQVVRLYLECVGEGKKVDFGNRFVRLFNDGKMPGLKEVLGEISLKSVYRWRKLLEENNWNPACLEPKWNVTTLRTITTKEAGLLIPMLLNPNRPLISEIISAFKKHLIELKIEPKSDVTYRRFIADWRSKNIDLWTLGRKGSKAFNDEILKSLVRNKDVIEVGDILVADGHKFNVMVINPLTGKPIRMTLVMFYDFKSDMPMGWEIMPTENTMVIASALRNAILRLGRFISLTPNPSPKERGVSGYVPKVVYLDNGRAFRGRYFNGIKDFRDTVIPGLFAKLKIETMFATPYHGQSKPIERWFKTLGEMERRLPSYTGNNIAGKPAMMMRNEKLHKRLFDNTAITVESLSATLDEFIQEYATEPHQNGFYKGLTPAEIFMESVERIKKNESYRERLIGKRELIYLMMSDEDRMISRNGIRFRGQYYWNEEMPGIIGSRVTIKYDLWDDRDIYVFDERGKFLFAGKKDDAMYHPAARLLGSEEDVRKLTDALAERNAYKKRVEEEFKAIVSMEKSEVRSQKLEVRSQESEEDKQALKGKKNPWLANSKGYYLKFMERQKKFLEG